MNTDTTTRQEEAALLAAGMEPWTAAELKTELERLNYYICPADSFNYTNRGNKRTYNAKSVNIKDKTSRKSFANIHTDNPNLETLQKIRQKALIVKNGRIWEL